MKLVKLLLVVASSLGVSTSVASVASARNVDLAALQIEAEAACDAALREDTIEALEEFLNRYPDVSTACSALATEALSQFAPSNDGVPSGIASGTEYSG